MSLRHAILGLLSIQPMSGYFLKKVIDQSISHFWVADQSQIYRTLAALVDDGLASRHTVVQEDRPNLHLHEPTREGLAELDRWLEEPAKPPPARDPFLVRLFFADRMSPEGIRRLLDMRRDETAGHLAALEAVTMPKAVPETVTALGYALRKAALDNGIAEARAELEWLDETRKTVERMTS